ncbi:hypothetical protein E2C01_012559 [Portunus trituberculatus]|uniref:Uncharacterized protein n=1 Tax=Portunus trituberculatus TaxID=210409 RepID=A0A5B7DEX5_PORTR|nr:hypothetical protein [Portunus trituberculatus]
MFESPVIPMVGGEFTPANSFQMPYPKSFVMRYHSYPNRVALGGLSVVHNTLWVVLSNDTVVLLLYGK